MGWNVLVVWECELKKKVAGETLENLRACEKNSVNMGLL